jgi:hypothetical protein
MVRNLSLGKLGREMLAFQTQHSKFVRNAENPEPNQIKLLRNALAKSQDVHEVINFTI